MMHPLTVKQVEIEQQNCKSTRAKAQRVSNQSHVYISALEKIFIVLLLSKPMPFMPCLAVQPALYAEFWLPSAVASY